MHILTYVLTYIIILYVLYKRIGMLKNTKHSIGTLIEYLKCYIESLRKPTEYTY